MNCPRWAGCLNHLLSPGHSVSQVHRESTVSGVLCVSSGELISGCGPPGDVNHLESQENVVSNWEPAYSLVEDAGLWSQYWSSPLRSTSGCQTTASLPLAWGGACMQLASSPLVFTQSFVLCVGQAAS